MASIFNTNDPTVAEPLAALPESVNLDLRRKVRRLLAMYGYPPDLSEDATTLVLRQAELSTEAGAA